MAKITRLTNATRNILRAPYLSAPVGPAILAALIPVLKKTAAKSVQPANDQHKNSGSKQKPAAQNMPQKNTQSKAPYQGNNGTNGSRPADARTQRGNPAPSAFTQSEEKSPRLPGSGTDNAAPRTAPRTVSQKVEPKKDQHQQQGADHTARQNNPHPHGLFVPTTRVVQHGNGNGISRQANASSLNPPTRPVPSSPLKPQPYNNTNGQNRNDSPRNGFSHSPIVVSKPAPQQSGPANPAAQQGHQEPPTQIPLKEIISAAVPSPETPSTPSAQPPVPLQKKGWTVEGVRQLLEQQRGLPAQTTLLGVCDDGLPVLLDLNDPKPGALVVIGDERELQLNLLRTAVASLALRSTPRSVQILILSCEPKAWQDWIAAQGFQRFFIGIEGVEDLEELSDWIIRLGDWTEQRRTGTRSGPPIFVVLDTLSFLPRLAYDIRLNFEWLAKEGPAAQIWPLAAISTDLAALLNNRRMLRSFPSRILGFCDTASFYTQIANMDGEKASQFGEPGVFAVQLGEEWLRFRLPDEKIK